MKHFWYLFFKSTFNFVHLGNTYLKSPTSPEIKNAEGYKCTLCPRIFTEYPHLVIHYCRSHYRNQLTQFVCEKNASQCKECERKFSKSSSLLYHIATTHNKLAGIIPEKRDFKMEASNKGIGQKIFSQTGK